jgi:hypothetical protein
MFSKPQLIIAVALALFSASASAGPVMYVATLSGQFGTVNTTTGAFNQIGATLSDPLGGLVQGPNGLLAVSFSGNLESVNPTTGAIAVIGPTGLGYNALDTAKLGGIVYETDFSNNLYTVNTSTGAATLVGYTGIPPAPSNPADNCDEALFTANGNLYATFDAVNTATQAVVINPELYQIDPTTGAAIPLAPTSIHLNAAVDVSGVIYAFQGQPATFTADVLSLNLATGNTSLLSSVGPSATPIDAAVVATPEPASLALAGIGIAAIAVLRRRNRR